jgi:hypothetical protein
VHAYAFTGSNYDPWKVPVVPFSADSGEFLAVLGPLLLERAEIHHSIASLGDVFTGCHVLEVRSGKLGPTVDVVLTSGGLSPGDTAVFCGVDGPIAAKVAIVRDVAPMVDLASVKVEVCPYSNPMTTFGDYFCQGGYVACGPFCVLCMAGINHAGARPCPRHVASQHLRYRCGPEQSRTWDTRAACSWGPGSPRLCAPKQVQGSCRGSSRENGDAGAERPVHSCVHPGYVS